MAEQQGNVAGIVSSELGIAKVFGLESVKEQAPQSFKDAKSMHDIGKRLLISVGLREPADDAVALAGSVQNLSHFRLAERHPALAHAVMAPEETLNALLDAEADRLCNAQRYERSAARRDTRAGHYERGLQTKAGRYG